MTAGALAFVAGVVLLQQQGGLPAAAWLWGLPACLALGALAPRAAPARRRGGSASCGPPAARICALPTGWPPSSRGASCRWWAWFPACPPPGTRALRFDFEPEAAPPGARLPRKLRLAWYAPPPPARAPMVHPGERWRFTLRLRRPHGQVNPYGFDYEAWLLERGIGATGYVRAFPAPQRLGQRGRRARSHRAGARGGARALPARARGDPGGGHPRRARDRRPARDLERGVAPVPAHRGDPPDEHLGAARNAGIGTHRVAGRFRLAPVAAAVRAAARAQGRCGRGGRGGARLHPARGLRRAGAANAADGVRRRAARCGRVASLRPRARSRSLSARSCWPTPGRRWQPASGFPSARWRSSSTSPRAGPGSNAGSCNGDASSGP